MFEESYNYCPIKTPEEYCGAGGECNRLKCWEKMHYSQPTNSIQEKMLKWREHRRGDLRWKNSSFRKS